MEHYGGHFRNRVEEMEPKMSAKKRERLAGFPMFDID